MASSPHPSALLGIHHVGITVGGPQEDRAFHGGLLGLRLLGRAPIVHGGRTVERLWYGAGAAAADTLISSLCLGADGPAGRRGSNGPKVINLAIPAFAADYWRERLFDHHVDTVAKEWLGEDRLCFTHPTGLEYALVPTDDDERPPAPGGEIPGEHAIRGLHGVTISLMDVREMTDFLLRVIGATHVSQDLAHGLFVLDPGAPANRIELLHEPYTAPGTWRYAVGTMHHVALEAADSQSRAELCRQMIEVGYTDISEEVDDGEYSSMWFRTPGGTLVDIVCSGRNGHA